jgi:predicted metal-binding transcription factor (methanogenesis marker protein 9)
LVSNPKRTNVFKIFLAVLIFGSFAVGGIYYKQSLIAKELKKELAKHENIKYEEVQCFGMQKAVCHIQKVQILEENKVIVKIEDVSIEDLHDFALFAKDKNGTLPFKLDFSEITFTENSGLDEVGNTKADVNIFGSFSIIGEEKFLNLDELKIEDSAIAIILGTEIKGRDEKDIHLKNIKIAFQKNIDFKNRLAEIKKKEGISETEFENMLEEFVAELKSLGNLAEKSGVKIKKFLLNDEITRINFSAETKDKKYLNLMKFYMEYFMTLSFGGDANKLIEKNIILNVESK